jgi:flagellar hook-length control protein FliK
MARRLHHSWQTCDQDTDMPDIAVAANIVATAKAASSADSASSAPTTAEPAAEGPFAAVLQRQMDSAGTDANNTQAAINGAPASDPAVAGMAAFLPLLLGSAAMTGSTTPAATPAQGSGKKPAGDDADIDPSTIVPLFAPAATVPITATATSTATGATQTPAGSSAPPSATTAVSMTANLAAATDAGATIAGADDKSDKAADASLVDSARAASQAIATPRNDIAAADAAGSAAHNRVVASAVGTQGWNTEIGNHMVWMANSQNSRADLVLTPPDLGKIEISVTMNGDHATATFVSASPLVRDAIENAIPRLRDVLANAGVTLGQTQVGAESQRQGTDQFRDNSFTGSAAVASGAGVNAPVAGISAWTTAGRGLVDVFA